MHNETFEGGGSWDCWKIDEEIVTMSWLSWNDFHLTVLKGNVPKKTACWKNLFVNQVGNQKSRRLFEKVGFKHMGLIQFETKVFLKRCYLWADPQSSVKKLSYPQKAQYVP
jgi:hypothetical protein